MADMKAVLIKHSVCLEEVPAYDGADNFFGYEYRVCGGLINIDLGELYRRLDGQDD